MECNAAVREGEEREERERERKSFLYTNVERSPERSLYVKDLL